MGLLINQGVHKESDFKPLIGTNVWAVIEEIALAKNKDGAITIKFRVLNGANKDKHFWDTVEYKADSQFAWKYKALRRAAGVPYQKGEPEKIDIENLLLNKAVLVDLSSREGSNGETYQSVSYKVSKGQTPPIATTTPASNNSVNALDGQPAELIEDDDLPF